ncbi:DUF3558 domain-containing protein [Lentzea nigeriaca]|uniref:DUF3558 domain-containing protein n=1 Tax=Lentzea nigeriaca TaxID=1128665 RepID=UPI00195AD06C|nr:DUF3558 domain-containing protein [Lentzea nigeriaca]MBM7860613.1 hypothetical protein [Lentzea nigeriaca]
MTALLTAVLVTGVLAGCSQKTPGNANTTTPTAGEQTSSSPTGSDSPSGLSIDKFVSKPCDILTAAQVAKLGSVRAPEPGTGLLGPLCTWKGQDVVKNSRYTISVTKGKDVEEMVATVKTDPVYTDHKVDGVRFVTSDATNGESTCATIIQVSKTDSVTLQVSVAKDERATKKPCTESETVSKMIVENLRG